MTERLDRLEQGMETLTNTLNLLVTEFIRPSAQQAAANHERLERIEAILERIAEGQSANEQQIGGNAEGFTEARRLIQGNAEGLTEARRLIQGNAEGLAETRELIQGNAEGLAETRELVQRNAERSAENSTLFENMLNDARADRIENRRRFDAAQQVIQAMLIQISSLNGRVEDLEEAS